MKQLHFCFLFTLILLSLNHLNAQNPGGVATGLSLWVKSNSNVSTTGGLVDSWGYANNANSYASTGTNRPTLNTSVINFNPVVSFTGGRRFMDGPTGANAPITAGDDDYTIFAVWKSNTVSAFQRVFSQRSTSIGSDDVSALSFATWNDGRYGDEVSLAPYDQGIQRSYTINTWNISQLNLLAQGTGDLEVIDDRNISTGVMTLNTDPGGTNGAGLRNISDLFHRLGSAFDVVTGQDLDGDIAEIIVYTRPISGAERAAVFSYLALKYGITLKTNLVSSGATTIWNAATNSAYNNSVFGLGRDDNSGALVTQSNSIETGSGNGTGQSGEANIVLSSASSLDNNDFLIIGTDNGALTESGSELPATAAGSFRLAREWKVQHTGNVGTVNATVDLNGITVTGASATNFRLMVDEDGNGNFADGTTRYYTPSSYAGGILTFNGLTLNNNEVFAIISSASAILPVTWVSFSGKLVNKNVQLDWQVANNELARVYEIEQSADGVVFHNIGSVSNQSAVKNYSFAYYGLITGVNYFRIRQIDMDGRAYFSRTIIVKTPDITFRVLNNPSQTNNTEIEINVTKKITASIELSSISGALISSQKITINPGINRFKLPMDKAAPGTYILKLKLPDTELSERVVKL
jgi:hypothetical protein